MAAESVFGETGAYFLEKRERNDNIGGRAFSFLAGGDFSCYIYTIL